MQEKWAWKPRLSKHFAWQLWFLYTKIYQKPKKVSCKSNFIVLYCISWFFWSVPDFTLICRLKISVSLLWLNRIPKGGWTWPSHCIRTMGFWTVSGEKLRGPIIKQVFFAEGRLNLEVRKIISPIRSFNGGRKDGWYQLACLLPAPCLVKLSDQIFRQVEWMHCFNCER